MRRQILVLAAVLTFLFPVCSQAAIEYEVIDLGTLGGDYSVASSINDIGQIVGWSRYELSSNFLHATLFDSTGAGNNIDLGTLGGIWSRAHCINNVGQIVGADYTYTTGAYPSPQAVLFDSTGDGNNIDLAGRSSIAWSINNTGQIVGLVRGRATLFDPNGAGDNIDLGVLDDNYHNSGAMSINNAGQILGTASNNDYYSRAVLFDSTGAGKNVDLGTLGGDWNLAYSINDAGQIVGYSSNIKGDLRATLFDPTGAGNIIDLGTIGGDMSEAYSISDIGQIVGYAKDSEGALHATLFDPTGAGDNIDLNTLIDPASGWTLFYARDINNSGWIVGEGINQKGNEHAFLLVPISSKYSGGMGEPNDPYQIATAEDLMLLGESPEDYDKHFIMIADVDLDPNLPGRKVFDKAVIAPDTYPGTGFQETYFAGVFNGNNHTILNLVIIGEEYLGLFGLLDSGAIIQNLGLEAVDINGTNRVGGLVGVNDGHIVASYSSGTVSGSGWAIGGLVGENDGRITGSYYSGTVSGGDFVGGLVGTNWDRITMSYSTGTIAGGDSVGGLAGENFGSADFPSYARITTSYSNCTVNGTSYYIGGLVGSNSACITASYSNGVVTGPDQGAGGLVGGRFMSRRGTGITVTSFWDIQTSGQSTSFGGTGLTTVEMQDINTYLSTGWDFVGEAQNGTCDYWQISLDGYPKLRFPVMPEGLGTVEQPYLIRDANDLGTVWFQSTAHYILEASIDLSDVTWSMPVVPRFDGTFDGNGFIISNLHIEGDTLVRLFGLLGGRGQISNLGLEAVDVNGTDDGVGGLVGFNYGTITSSYSTGIVNGKDVGGLVGISYGNITASYSTGLVGGDYTVGGLVGSNDGNITTSYSTAEVSGTFHIGGLAGRNGSNIISSYSAGAVSGNSWDSVGGMVGSNNWGACITSSFWDIETSGLYNMCGNQTSDAIGCDNSFGKTTAEMQTASTFLEAGWDFMDETKNGTDDIWWIEEENDYPRLWWERE